MQNTLVIGFAAASLVFVGLPLMAVVHTVVAQRMDAYRSEQEGDAKYGDEKGEVTTRRRSSVDSSSSCGERSTSMSAFPSAAATEALTVEEKISRTTKMTTVLMRVLLHCRMVLIEDCDDW